jgi:hypothetical protein
VKVSFLSLAQKELVDAVAWYNEPTFGLGIEFLVSWTEPFGGPRLFLCPVQKSNQKFAAAL